MIRYVKAVSSCHADAASYNKSIAYVSHYKKGGLARTQSLKSSVFFRQVPIRVEVTHNPRSDSTENCFPKQPPLRRHGRQTRCYLLEVYAVFAVLSMQFRCPAPSSPRCAVDKSVCVSRSYNSKPCIAFSYRNVFSGSASAVL